MELYEHLNRAYIAIKQGGIVAYPTEAVFGLGCDPMNERAVHRISEIKRRPQHKNYILIGSDFAQLQAFCEPIDESRWQRIKQDWPGPYTWIFPASKSCPRWLAESADGIAVRVTAHSVAAALCELCGHALVSTSANISGEPPTRTWHQTETLFGAEVDYIVRADVSDPHADPTTIHDAISGRHIR